MFITLEGIEGSGKTSQVERLAAYFEARGMATLVTREPGGTDIGRKIRAILLDPENKDLSSVAELLLYMADRAQHLEVMIKPALKQGKTVICDRYADATVVYQGYARGLTPDLMHRLHHLLFDDLKPDLTLLLDLDPEVGLARAWRQLDGGLRSRREGRFEEEKLAFHERVRSGYLDLARQEPARFRVIDAAQEEQAVWEDIRRILDRHLDG
jgi:dTMP kinase